ncbi:protein TAPETUM DETERMINANT 1-like [Panicum miliaceum]|uniref:Protein TAPETUM DETERMINANT 1-like n=1 Tax=Panicum miliaceum TaxID=4540 RepID=A0A3L6QC47_PANMI|nr:protein TAPETUM DETERMINANT 1-like [Panicum miliaceum]
MAYIPKATILLFLVALTCSEHIGNAKGSCQLSDIHISQVVTGKVVEGQPQFQVTIGNRCSCPQAEVMVSCFGLPSIGTVDKTKIHVVDSELCSVANGLPIAKGSPVIFTYAKMTPQDFPVVSAKPRC